MREMRLYRIVLFFLLGFALTISTSFAVEGPVTTKRATEIKHTGNKVRNLTKWKIIPPQKRGWARFVNDTQHIQEVTIKVTESRKWTPHRKTIELGTYKLHPGDSITSERVPFNPTYKSRYLSGKQYTLHTAYNYPPGTAIEYSIVSKKWTVHNKSIILSEPHTINARSYFRSSKGFLQDWDLMSVAIFEQERIDSEFDNW